MEEIIIHTVRITKSAEYKFFEIPLPNDGISINSLWYKIRLLDDATRGQIITSIRGRSPYNPELIAGELSLSSHNQEGVFFYGNLILENENSGLLDYTAGVFPAKTYNRDTFQKPLQIKVDADTSCVNGFIHDRWGTLNNRNLNYEVDIYLFVERKEKSK